MQISNTAAYFPILYVPGAVGIGIARLLRSTPYDTVFMARYANALFYTAMGVVSLILIRRGRIFLFAVLCLPHSLFLAGSCNQDCMLLACMGLAASLLTRLEAPFDDRIGPPDSYWGRSLRSRFLISHLHY